jgi:hypothetical protein
MIANDGVRGKLLLWTAANSTKGGEDANGIERSTADGKGTLIKPKNGMVLHAQNVSSLKFIALPIVAN